MSDTTIIVLAVLWWTFAVAAIAQAIAHEGKMHWRVIGYCMFWPALLPFLGVAVIYDMAVKSTLRLRADLKNRKLLKEFDAYLRERDNK